MEVFCAAIHIILLFVLGRGPYLFDACLLIACMKVQLEIDTVSAVIIALHM